MTRRFFFGLIPALLAAAKWPIEKLRGKSVMDSEQFRKDWRAANAAGSSEVAVIPPGATYPHQVGSSWYVTKEMLDDAVVPATWLEDKLRSEIDI